MVDRIDQRKPAAHRASRSRPRNRPRSLIGSRNAGHHSKSTDTANDSGDRKRLEKDRRHPGRFASPTPGSETVDDRRRHERNAIKLIQELPAEGESLHFVVDGHFEPCDLIPVTRRLVSPKIIKRLDITTLGFNRDNVACIANGMDQCKIGQVSLVCSHYFAKAEPENFEYLQTEIGGRGGRVAGLRTHSKLILMEISDGRCFTIEGSGNLRSCKSIEQFAMTNDRPLLEFHRGWLEDYINSRGNDGKYNKLGPAKPSRDVEAAQ